MTQSRRIWTKLSLVLMSVVSGIALTVLLAATPVQAASMTQCQPVATLSSLKACVHHAAQVGGITSAHVTHTLLEQVKSAQEAVEDHHSGAAIERLEQFMHEVRVQTGVSIQPDHAAHLIMHAQLVINALESAPKR